jgi:cysteine desulfurase
MISLMDNLDAKNFQDNNRDQMARGIYLDNSMAAQPSDHALSRMMPFLKEKWSHPSSPHQKGQELFPALEESYKAIYQMLGAKEKDHFVFTSSGAEAINHVILSAYTDITLQSGRNQYISSNSEEAPALMSIGRLEQYGCVGKMVGVDRQGRVTAEAIAEVLTPRTALISLGWANGMTGVIQPILEISQLCQEKGIALHLDATHVLGKLFIDLDDLNISFITFNGDPLHAPRGTGGLYIRGGVSCSGFILGGLEQGGKRAGSFNVPGLVALGQAANELSDTRDLLNTEIARLRNKLEEGIQDQVPEAQICFKHAERLPHVTTIMFPGIANESLLYTLNRRGVYASIGGGSFQQIGLLLEAAGIEKTLAHTALSFSLSRLTTEEEIDRAIEIISESAKKLRKASITLIPKGTA